MSDQTPRPSYLSPSKGVNRAEAVDANFLAFCRQHRGGVARPAHSQTLGTSSLCINDLLELIESQLISRHLDLMARVLRVQNKVFYTIGSSGHEGNALVARATRHTDPAFLHYRSGGFMAERFRKLPGMDPIMDSALSFAASSLDPASGGRHKVWGSKPLWVLPQTSTIASHLPKAYGTALGIELATRLGQALPIPNDSITICSFGDASANHSTAQGAFNAAQWTAYQGLNAPALFVCEDNGIGISVKSPSNWIAASFKNRTDLDYFYADGLDLAAGFDGVKAAVEHCRKSRRPTFLHLKTVRLMGHAGTDFEIEYRALEDVLDGEAADPLLKSAALVLDSGALTPAELIALYESIRAKCFAAADVADKSPKITTLADIVAPLAPYSPELVHAEATRASAPERRAGIWGELLPEAQPPKHLAININLALHDLLLKYPNAVIFGEDVAQKGGVYTVTRNLFKTFKGARIFNTLLDEQTILGLAQGFANVGLLPMPEIQYLAYFHNACDQIRGEACSLQFFSNNQFKNPIVMRMASLGYQKGFGGHFHNDNSITALRDIPALIVGCPSRGDDAAMMLRTLMALAKIDGRVCAFLEPIALYMTKDLHSPGDGEWQFNYPAQDQALTLGDGRVYFAENTDLLIISYGNGVLMALRAAKQLQQNGKNVRVLDLRWLQPLNRAQIAEHARACKAVLIVDEGRESAGIAEGVFTAIMEAGLGAKPCKRVVGTDTYTPLASAATLVLPSDDTVLAAARALVG
jgi:2-oxoisovalerate dehydrogenase E1 component